jgi:type I restriction enzyme S subunit
MERYSSYKDSGVQWIGKVPSHWRIPSIGKIFEIKAGGDAKPQYYSFEQDEKHPYPVYTNTKDSNSVYAYTSKPLYDSGTITVTGRGEIGRAIFRPVPYDAIIRLLSLRPKVKLVPKFYAFFIDTVIPFTSDSAAIGQLSAVQLKPKYVTFPPLAEQEKIVSYLEGKTSKIDAYVADKEKEIELLQELKQKTIADAVTKGLNPDTKMKDSGISWIGEIPEHWETRRAKFMFKKNKRERRPEDEVITCFRDGQVTLRKNRRLTGFTESEKYDGYQGIRKGDLVIHQMDAFAGSIGVSDSDGMGTSVYHCCTPTGDYNVYYYANLIRQMALSGFIQSLYKGIRERSSDFSFPVFGNQYLIIPPQDEQQAIVAYIEEKCQKIDKLASELQSEIDYLKEYKQRLIADCVTGQVNVQNEMK